MPNYKKVLRRTLRTILGVLTGLILLFVTLVLLIRTPWAQSKIVNKAISYVSDKTGTVVELERLFITFTGNVYLEGLYLEDTQGDSLIYIRSFETGVALKPLLDKEIHITKIDWDGLRAHVKRSATDSTFNFNFLIDAFVSKDSLVVEDPVDTTEKVAFKLASVGPISLSDFQLTYDDKLEDMLAYLALGNLELENRQLDLDSLNFDINSLVLENSKIRFYSGKSLSSGEMDEDSSASTIPTFIVDNLELKNIDAEVSIPPDSISANLAIGLLALEVKNFNLNTNRIEVEDFIFKDSRVIAKLPKGSSSPGTENDFVQMQNDSVISIAFPDMNIKVGSIQMENNYFEIHRGNKVAKTESFDPDHIVLSDLDLEMQNIYLSKKGVGLELNSFDFKERSEWELKDLSFNLKSSEKSFELNKLNFQTTYSRVSMDLAMSYSSLDDLINRPEKATLNLDFKPSILSLQDAFYFAPELRKDTVLAPFHNKPFGLDGSISGRVGDADLKDFAIDWGANTHFKASGNIKGLPDPKALVFNFPKISLESVIADYASFIPKDTLPVNIPAKISLNTSLNGTLEDLKAKGLLNIPEGKLVFDAHLNQKGIMSFDADLSFNKMDLGALLKNDTLGLINLDIDFKGSGKDIKTMTAELKGKLRSIVIGEQEFKDISFEGNLANQLAEFSLSSTQPSLLLDLKANANLDSLHPEYNVLLDIKNLDANKLALSKDDMNVSGKLTASMKGPMDNFVANVNITNARVVKNNIKYDMEEVIILADSDANGSEVTIESDLLSGKIDWNTDINALITGLNRFAAPYIGKDPDTMQVGKEVILKGVFTFDENSVLQELLIPQLQTLEAGDLTIDFNSAENKMGINWDIEQIHYTEMKGYNIAIDVSTGDESLNLDIAWDSILHPSAKVYKTSLTGKYNGETFGFKADILDKEEVPMYFFEVAGEMEDEDLIIRVLPEKILLNRANWNISPNNQISILRDRILARDFVLSQGVQKISIANKANLAEDHLGLIFENFQVATFSAMFQPEDERVDGVIEGEVWAINLFSTPSFVADLEVNNITYQEMQVGNLRLDAVSKSAGNYAANLVISGGAADLVLDGSYSVAGEKTTLNLDLDIKSVELALIENFTNKAISDAAGTMSGKVKITGSPEKPIYDGSFQFRNAAVTVSAVNERFTLADEQLSVRNQGVYFDRFTIRDSRGESSAITGRIDTEKSLTNPEFFLDIDAKDFRMLNSTRQDNDMYFGSLLADLDISVRGNLEKPVVSGRVRLNRGSNVTFIIPETQVAAVDKEGVVVFVNMKDSTARDSAVIDAFQTDMIGLQLSAIIEVDSSTTFTIVIDEQSGDNLLIRGEANLSVDMESNGRIGISGEYRILDGHYEMSLYEIVQRRFELTRGSRITWTGEPLRGALDLTALYRTKTSTVDLMGSQLAGADQATINRYRQDLPFEVLLKIKGTLLRPDISFGLDMPELQRNAIGGNVYNKIQQLNENESELNKQVFSLIVLNRFLPEDLSQASGGGGGANEMARSSVSKLLSSQLNSLSGKYIKGIDLDFNLDSYTDYQTGAAQNRTQLNVNLRKALLNDRLIVSVGSQLDLEGENPNDQPGAGDIIGDISLDYLLVPDGRYRLRGFRRNEFEGIIDGQIVVTGLSIAYNKDFDNIRELWKKPVVIQDSLPEVKEKKED